MGMLVLAVGYLVQFLAFAIFARAILTWFPIDRNGPIVQFLNAVTDPVLEPLRKVIPPIGMIDITPMVAMLLLFFIASALLNSASSF
ncbi:MAG: YggT family protein [Dehalococcoidia bacterium]|nr:YggT family protein [Dehalococcoidia bacterium]MCA9857140.1 YggT family protein [Dehalococcoidia bacterium]MCB9483020.1 YggT family protein [Dehalococcoidia bacterium]MCB9491724.1 YggT family protein [Dehalococcoidia bacterium]